MRYDELENNKGKSRISIIYTYLLVISVWANTYSLGAINVGYGELLLLLLLPIMVDSRGFRSIRVTRASAYFIIYMLYTGLISFVVALSIPSIVLSDTIVRLIRNLFYILLYLSFSKNFFSYQDGRKALRILCISLSVFMIFQFVMYNAFGIYFNGIINGLSINTEERIEKILLFAGYRGYLRTHGFLSEPASCAHILFLALDLELLAPDTDKIHWRIVTLYTVAMLLTVSANAYVYLLAAYAFLGIKSLRAKSKGTRAKAVLGSVCLIAIVIILYYFYTPVRDVVNRLQAIDESGTNSSGLRVIRGWAFYNEIPFLYKIVGIGRGNFLGFKSYFGINTPYEIAAEYMSTLSSYFVSTGLIGVALVFISVIEGLKHKTFTNKALFVSVVLLCVASSVGYTMTFVLFISFIFYNDYSTGDYLISRSFETQ